MISDQKVKNSHGPMINRHLLGAGSCVKYKIHIFLVVKEFTT